MNAETFNLYSIRKIHIKTVGLGNGLYYAKQAAEILGQQGIEAEVIDMHTIKPLDTECVDAQLDKKLIVTVEEATI